MTDAFTVPDTQLLRLMLDGNKKEGDLVKSNNSAVVHKFCEMSLFLNIDPLHKWALHMVVILMCRNKDPMGVARKFSQDIGCPEIVRNVESSPDLHNKCSSMCSTMSDWIALFNFLELSIAKAPIAAEAEASFSISRAGDPRDKTRMLLELEQSPYLQRMTSALAEAQVAGEKMMAIETALWVFLYMSPRTTPAGSMLERLYSSINSNARDSELRCLRAMSIFNDKIDNETGYADTMSLVLRAFEVKEHFPRLVETVLRQRKEVSVPTGPKTLRPILRSYASTAVQSRSTKTSSENWSIWRNMANFPITTSLYVQKLLYFICVQTTPPDMKEYKDIFHVDLLRRVTAMKVHEIDVGCIIDVMGNLRTYNGEITSLIDFRHKCLFGINEKTRQELTLTKVLQLYISMYQHPSVVEACWRHVVPVYNHTIRTNIEEFKTQNAYQVSQVVRNLVQNILE